jgi:transcriptional regulator with PAS, ATPase and Fis domain
MEQKKFRRDLYYRLCVVPIMLPPLRQRRLDIPVFVNHFLEKTAHDLQRAALEISTEAIDRLTQYAWPGNVRELRNAIEYAYVKCHGGLIEVRHLPHEIANFQGSPAARPGPRPKKKEAVLPALAQAEGNKHEAARLMGVSRATLYRYLDLYALKS